MESYQVAFLVAFLLTTFALPFTLKILRSRGHLDRPNERSSHTVPTPRGAGLAQIVGGAGALASSGGLSLSGVVALAGFSVLGASDDIKPRSAVFRLVLQMAIATLAVAIAFTSNFSFDLKLFLVGILLTLVMVGMVNVTNFMDGINGISVIHGVIFGLVYGIILWRADITEWVSLAAALIGVSLAVLPWNWGKTARIFLGDSGSYLLGISISILMIVTWLLGPGLLIALAPVSIYLVDTGSTLIQRVIRRESLTVAHRDHVYQRLVRSGWSHPKTAVFVACFSTFVGLIALALEQGELTPSIGFILLIITASVFLASPLLLGREAT